MLALESFTNRSIVSIVAYMARRCMKRYCGVGDILVYRDIPNNQNIPCYISADSIIIFTIYLFIYLIIYKIHVNAPRVVKVHHKEHQANEPLARLL